MSIFREVITATRATLVLWILTALIYPFLMIFIGQVFFPDRANGSLITNEQDRVIGSALIGQPFSSDRYFWSRPSTTEYSTGEDAAPTGVSGASNLAPSNSELIDRVCVSTYPHSSRLLRRGARLASQMRARLYALYVANPDRFLTKDESMYLEMCEQFCQEFGGEFIRVNSTNIPKAIAETAHQYHITQVILGQTHRSRWALFLHSSPVQQLLKYLSDVDLHIIATNKIPEDR